MKKLITLMLCLSAYVSGYANNTNTKVFYAVSSATVGNYTIRLNFQLKGDEGPDKHWYYVNMTNTGLTYNGLDIYVGVFQDWYDGVNNLQFQLYDGETKKSEVVAISNTWTSASTYNTKMYTGSSWIAPSTDETITIHYTNPDSWTTSTIQAHAWNSISDNDRTYDTNYNGNWGENSTISGNSLNSGYYDFTYSNIYNRVMFNDNGSGDNKTSVISVDYSTAREFWVSANDATSASTTVPTGWVCDKRTDLTIGDFGTICLPYAATVTGATIYTIENKVVDGTLKGINLQEYTDPLVAGKAYIYKATGTTLTATYSSGSYTQAKTDDVMQGNLYSKLKKVDPDVDNYIINGNKIRKVVKDGEGESNVTIGQYRAFIKMSDVSEATSAPGLNFIPFFDNTPSGINTIEASESKINGYFNLNGQRVAQPTKGLYIVNGKKVVLK